MPLSSQKTAPPAWLHSPVAAHCPPRPTVPPLPPPCPHNPLMQTRPPQQFLSSAQAPPSLRQQFSAPSASIPFEAQTAGPDAWLHCPVCEHSAPMPRPPDVLFVQTPLTQYSPPQQSAL